MIPITESMKDPHKFPRVLTVVMIGVMFLFAGAGVLAYAAYGSAIQVRLVYFSDPVLTKRRRSYLSTFRKTTASSTPRSSCTPSPSSSRRLCSCSRR